MKKIIFVSVILVALSVIFLFTACGPSGYADAFDGGYSPVYSADGMKTELDKFLAVGGGDRTCLVSENAPEDGSGEYAAAEWIAGELETLTGQKGKIVSFERDVYTDSFESQNVVFSLKAPAENNPEGYKVVIGAHYDNMYDTCESGDGRAVYFRGTRAAGAMGNGAAVAALLNMCDIFADNTDGLSTDVDFVFYGMGCIDYGGADEYWSGLGERGRDSVILAVTLERLGGSDLWMWFDEQSTAHGDFILGTAAGIGCGDHISLPPARQTDPDVILTDSLPYTPYPLMNETSVYFGKTNVCSVTSGSDFTFLLTDNDGYGREDISYTSRDTLERLEHDMPDYADQMRVAAETLTASVFGAGFTGACLKGLEQIGAYDWLTSRLAAYIAGAVLAAGVLAFTLITVSRLRKKYAGEGGRPNIKVAVFGMDYEDPEDGDVYVDIRSGKPNGPEDPFGDDPFGTDGGDKDGKT